MQLENKKYAMFDRFVHVSVYGQLHYPYQLRCRDYRNGEQYRFFPQFTFCDGNVGAASGVINSCVYVGAAGFTYGFALLSEQQGWSFTLLTWVVIGLLGTVLCVISARPWQKQFTDEPLE